MILKRLKLNSLIENIVTNCYIIEDEETKETMVIDPAWELDKITEVLDILDGKLKYIYLTHCHADHIGAVDELKRKKGGVVLIRKDIEADSRVNDGDILHIGNLEFRVIHTPGHTKGGSSLYCEQEKMLFSGDTLFKGMWGRTDLPTSNFADIINSIDSKLLVLPEETIVYPGHGTSTKLEDEEPIYYNLTAGPD